MPKRVVEKLKPVEHLSILDKNGKVDSKLEPEIDDDILKRIHRTMLFARRFDEYMLKLQRQGRIGTFAPIKGQEAANVGAAACLKEEDWLIPSFRETAAQLWRGADVEQLLLFAAGYNEGMELPSGIRDFPLCVPVASQLQYAVGVAYGNIYRDEDSVVMVFHGDGATSEGDFHEAMNFASTWEMPVVFVCQNNQWAISVPRKKQMRSPTVAQKAAAYDIPGLQVDGNDALAVYAACQEAVERARKEHIPTLIECVTYRMSVHTTADDPTKYRSEDEVKEWADKDPIERFQKYLKKKNLLSEDDLEEMESAFKDELKKAWRRTEKKIKELDNGPKHIIFDHMYAEEPPHIAEQREAFKQMHGEGADD